MNSRQDLTVELKVGGKVLPLATTWGLFSPKAVDEGTQLLINHLEIKPTDDCFDLGCGYGPIGIAMASLAPQGITHMVDKDFVAIEYAARNAAANNLSNAQAYLSNGFSHVPSSQTFDVIATNLPAKINNELIEIFLADAFLHLNPGGRFYIVTISGLREFVKRQLGAAFGNYKKCGSSKTYTAARAIKE